MVILRHKTAAKEKMLTIFFNYGNNKDEQEQALAHLPNHERYVHVLSTYNKNRYSTLYTPADYNLLERAIVGENQFYIDIINKAQKMHMNIYVVNPNKTYIDEKRLSSSKSYAQEALLRKDFNAAKQKEMKYRKLFRYHLTKKFNAVLNERIVYEDGSKKKTFAVLPMLAYPLFQSHFKQIKLDRIKNPYEIFSWSELNALEINKWQTNLFYGILQRILHENEGISYAELWNEIKMMSDTKVQKYIEQTLSKNISVESLLTADKKK